MNFKGIYLGVLSNVLGNFLMLGVTVWMTHILAPDEFGEFRVAASFATLMVPFLALGGERLVSKLIQAGGNVDAAVGEALHAVLMIACLGAAVVAIMFPLLSSFVFDGNVGLAVFISSVLLIPLTIAYNLANTVWRHTGSPASAQVHLNLTQRLLRVPLLAVMSLIWPSALSASLAMLMAQAVSLVQIRKNLQRFMRHKGRALVSSIRGSIGELAVIGFPVAFMASVDRLDVLLVNNTMGVARAGVYDLVFMLSLTAMFPAMAMSKTAEPSLLLLKENEATQSRLRRLQVKTCLLSYAAVVGMIVFAPIIQGLLGNAGPDFVSAAIILSAGLAFSCAYGPVMEYLQINGRQKATMWFVFFILVIFFVLKYFVAKTGSLVGVAACAGLFYFVLRAVLAAYIYARDRILMTNIYIIISSLVGYIAVAIFVWSGL